MLKEKNGLSVEIKELVSVKKIDVKYGKEHMEKIMNEEMLGTTRWTLL